MTTEAEWLGAQSWSAAVDHPRPAADQPHDVESCCCHRCARERLEEAHYYAAYRKELDQKYAAESAPTYTISQASQHINELETHIKWWEREYSLLAERYLELQDSRERLRIYATELEGVRDDLYDDIRQLHGEIDGLQQELATAKSDTRTAIAQAAVAGFKSGGRR